MRRFRVLARHPLAGPTIRYGLAGATVASVYLAIPLILNGGFGVAIEIVIPIAYLIAVSLHFNLQRHFVFRHVDEFALSTRQQIGRYVAIGVVQYPTTALATALLPGLLGVSERVVFVAMTVVISVIFFLLLRTHVFHSVPEEELTVPGSAHSETAPSVTSPPVRSGSARSG